MLLFYPRENTMLVTLYNNMKEACSPPLLDVVKDSGYTLLSQHPDGLISRYHSASYCIIVKGKKDVAVAHVLLGNNIEHLITNMVNDVSRNAAEKPVVYLARSPKTYMICADLLTFQGKRGGASFKPEKAVSYFKREDKMLFYVFRKYTSLKPKIVDMPDDFLVVDARGDILINWSPTIHHHDDSLDDLYYSDETLADIDEFIEGVGGHTSEATQSYLPQHSFFARETSSRDSNDHTTSSTNGHTAVTNFSQ